MWIIVIFSVIPNILPHSHTLACMILVTWQDGVCRTQNIKKAYVYFF